MSYFNLGLHLNSILMTEVIIKIVFSLLNKMVTIVN